MGTKDHRLRKLSCLQLRVQNVPQGTPTAHLYQSLQRTNHLCGCNPVFQPKGAFVWIRKTYSSSRAALLPSPGRSFKFKWTRISSALLNCVLCNLRNCVCCSCFDNRWWELLLLLKALFIVSQIKHVFSWFSQLNTQWSRIKLESRVTVLTMVKRRKHDSVQALLDSLILLSYLNAWRLRIWQRSRISCSHWAPTPAAIFHQVK